MRSSAASHAPHTGEHRDGFTFCSDRPCLAFAATLRGRLKPAPLDLLAAPADLDRWFRAAGLAREATHPTGEDLAAARDLREAIYRMAVARLGGAPLDPGDRALVNRWASVPLPAPQLGDPGIQWIGVGVPALLAALARDAVELLGGPLAARLRRCARPGCAVLFVDASRGNRRRWCSMSSCGNQAKVAAFRRRGQEPA